MAERPEDERTARGQAHPARETLIRFARGKATSDETRSIARHLLAGCHQCSAILWPDWKTAERLARRRAAKPQLARQQRG